MSASIATGIVSDLPTKTRHLQSQLRAGVDVKSLWTTPRRRCFLPLEQKAQLIAYMDEHYAGWRERTCEQAATFLTMTPEQAKGPRAQRDVAALGKAWWATGDEQYVQAYERLYLRTATGELFNWGQFAGGQAYNEFPAHLLMLDSPAYTDAGKVAVLDHLLELNETSWQKHTSKWSTLMLGPEGHNWYIHGIEAQPFLATLFPELKDADFQLKTSWSIVEEHLRGNYHRDGGSRERTPGYHGGSIRILWSMYAMTRHNQHEGGIKPSGAFESNLLRATHFLISAMTPLGGIPAFGDTGPQAGALAPILALAAALSGDGLCKWAAMQAYKHVQGEGEAAADRLPLSAFWMLGMDGAKAYAAVSPKAPGYVSSALPDSGFCMMRKDWRDDTTYMAINAAARGPIVTSHEHNDIFSFDLYAKGTRFLGQAGIAGYSNLPGRNYDVSTRAHNCLTLKDQEQLPIANQWRWSTTVIPRIRRWDITDSLEIFHGVHEGFCRHTPHSTPQKPDQLVIHERKILFLKSDESGQAASSYWVILDRVTTNQSVPCEVWFHGCVGGTTVDQNLRLKAADDNMLYICPPVNDELALTQDTSDDRKAYAKEANFDLQTHPAYCYAANVEPESHVFAWVLMPVSDENAMPRVERLRSQLNGNTADSGEVTSLRITHGNVVDDLCVSHLLHDAQIGLQAENGNDSDDQPGAWGQTLWRRTTGGQTREILRSTLDGSQEVLV